MVPETEMLFSFFLNQDSFQDFDTKRPQKWLLDGYSEPSKMNKFLLGKSAQFWRQNSHSFTHLFIQLFVYPPKNIF